MKKTFKLMGLAAVVAVLVVGLVACGGGSLKSIEVKKGETVATSSTEVKVGDTLTISKVKLKGDVDLTLTAAGVTIKWLRDGTAITGATTASYTLATADEGKVITAEVSIAADYTQGGTTHKAHTIKWKSKKVAAA